MYCVDGSSYGHKFITFQTFLFSLDNQETELNVHVVPERTEPEKRDGFDRLQSGHRLGALCKSQSLPARPDILAMK